MDGNVVTLELDEFILERQACIQQFSGSCRSHRICHDAECMFQWHQDGVCGRCTKDLDIPPEILLIELQLRTSDISGNLGPYECIEVPALENDVPIKLTHQPGCFVPEIDGKNRIVFRDRERHLFGDRLLPKANVRHC